MDTCVVFVKDMTEQGCLCFKINDLQEIVIPPEVRPFESIKALQQDCKTLIIESSLNAHILTLELPWLAERKARVAIPYALEDKLAQPVENIHFCFDKLHHQNGRYEIIAIAKSRMHFITQSLSENQIEFDSITLDWFAINPHEVCVTDYGMLVHQENVKGAFAKELAQLYQVKHPKQDCIKFANSATKLYSKTPKADESFEIWAAKRLIQSNPMNLCQGEFQQNNSTGWIKKGYVICGALFVTWLITLVVVNAISLYVINKKTAVIDKDIATIYHQFFPDAKQIISPKFRINQLLKGNDPAQQNQLLRLLNQFSKAYPRNDIIIEQIRYQNQSLSISMVCTDFPTLQALESKLKNQNLNLKQTQASTQEGRVYATLEIS